MRGASEKYFSLNDSVFDLLSFSIFKPIFNHTQPLPMTTQDCPILIDEALVPNPCLLLMKTACKSSSIIEVIKI